MRILLDECLPRPLRRDLVGHDTATVQEQGWAGTKNGLLLRRAAAGFQIFRTMDRGLQYQQHLPTIPLAIVLLRTPSNDLADLRPLVPELLAALPGVQPGEVQRIGASA